jgi:hypothetical protein
MIELPGQVGNGENYLLFDSFAQKQRDLTLISRYPGQARSERQPRNAFNLVSSTIVASSVRN